jgi:hypothetical protein
MFSAEQAQVDWAHYETWRDRALVAGLGGVTPSVGDAAPGPSNPLSYSSEFNDAAIGIYFGDAVDAPVAAKVEFAGLSRCCIGLYQANVALPASGLANGKTFIRFKLAKERPECPPSQWQDSRTRGKHGLGIELSSTATGSYG